MISSGMRQAGKCILVLGMHRSGTSALTGLLCRFGAIVGTDLLPANESNPKGYFESKAVVQLNNAILHAAGSAWDDTKALTEGWHRLPAMEAMRDSISALLSSQDVAAGLRVIKDPRLSKTLPLWRDVLADRGIQPVVVICVREPDVVAQSEKLMKGFPVLKSLLLYLDYGLQAEFHSRGLPCAIVSYTDLLADWQRVLKRIDADLDLGLLLEGDAWQALGEGFISPELNRSQPDADEFRRCGSLGEMAYALYQALQAPVSNELYRLRQRFTSYQDDIQPWGALLQHVQALEGRFPDVDLGPRYGYSIMQSRLEWSDALAAEFETTNSLVSKWVYGVGQKSVCFNFKHPCLVEKIRLIISMRPACVRLHSLTLLQRGRVLCRWGRVRESLIGQSKSAFDLTDNTNQAFDTWLFVDSKSYVDLKLPGNRRFDLDVGFSLEMTIELADISEAVRLLLAKLSEQRQAQAGKITDGGSPVTALVTDLADLHGSLQRVLDARDQKIDSQQKTLERMREELLRAEAQLDFLKQLMLDQRDGLRL